MTKTTTKKTKPIPELQPNPFQHEILELVSKQRSSVKKAEVLQKDRNEGLVALLIWNFDDSIVSVLPDGPVPEGLLPLPAERVGQVPRGAAGRAAGHAFRPGVL